jgi:hypothetical protein
MCGRVDTRFGQAKRGRKCELGTSSSRVEDQDFPGTEWADKGRGFRCRSHPLCGTERAPAWRFLSTCAGVPGPRGVCDPT